MHSRVVGLCMCEVRCVNFERVIVLTLLRRVVLLQCNFSPCSSNNFSSFANNYCVFPKAESHYLFSFTDFVHYEKFYDHVIPLFWKQVTVHFKGKTECYECQPKPAPKTYPVCTITSTPSKVLNLLGCVLLSISVVTWILTCLLANLHTIVRI